MAILRLLHAWSGAFLSLILIVLGLSGALLVFKNDWVNATMSAASGPTRTDAAHLGKITQRIETAFQAQGPKSVVFAGDGVGLHKVALKDDTSAWVSEDGANIALFEPNERLEDWLFDLHHHLLAGDTGETIAGLAGLAGALLTITGLVLTWPSLLMFAFRVSPLSGKRAHLLAAHRDLGTMLAPLVLLSLVTGSMIIFSDQTRPLFQVVAPGPKVPKPPVVGSGKINWPLAVANAQNRFPNATVRLVIWPAEKGKPATVRLRQAGEWHTNGRTIVWIDPATSKAVGVVDAQMLGKGDRAWNSLWPLHASKLGTGFRARIVDVMTALTGLGLAALGAYGLVAFVRGRLFGVRKKRTALQVS